MSASLQLMKITGYTDENFSTPYSGNPYTVMINPDSIKWSRNVEYNEVQAPDTSSPSQKYKSTPCEKLSFDLVIDCTGIVDSSRTDMDTELTALEGIIYKYNGSIHRPNFVGIQWGEDISFNGVLSSFETNFTLFSPNGSPLRAKISLSFSEYIAPTTVVKQDAPKSPDLTHMLVTMQNTSLPQMCQQVWNDYSLYVKVARFNGLNKFRNLPGGINLLFPPIK
ncbi:MAG: hypothetical protein IM638_07775 [Bacteroidetes bacterium]|nr:hypothetical protein [Bacteroidota bacterium]